MSRRNEEQKKTIMKMKLTTRTIDDFALSRTFP